MSSLFQRCPVCGTGALGDEADRDMPCPVCGARMKTAAADNEPPGRQERQKTRRPEMEEHDTRYACTRCGERIESGDEHICPECGAVYCGDCRETDPYCDECCAEID